MVDCEPRDSNSSEARPKGACAFKRQRTRGSGFAVCNRAEPKMLAVQFDDSRPEWGDESAKKLGPNRPRFRHFDRIKKMEQGAEVVNGFDRFAVALSAFIKLARWTAIIELPHGVKLFQEWLGVLESELRT